MTKTKLTDAEIEEVWLRAVRYMQGNRLQVAAVADRAGMPYIAAQRFLARERMPHHIAAQLAEMLPLGIDYIPPSIE